MYYVHNAQAHASYAQLLRRSLHFAYEHDIFVLLRASQFAINLAKAVEFAVGKDLDGKERKKWHDHETCNFVAEKR